MSCQQHFAPRQRVGAGTVIVALMVAFGAPALFAQEPPRPTPTAPPAAQAKAAPAPAKPVVQPKVEARKAPDHHGRRAEVPRPEQERHAGSATRTGGCRSTSASPTSSRR